MPASLPIRGSEVLLFAAAIGLSLVILEFGLRVFTGFPITTETNRVEHPQLGHTSSPRLEDVDSNGFRNTQCRLVESDLVTIGDSHTYGYNVSIENSFPSILARITEKCVYSFGVGGYGIYQYKILLDEVAEYSVRDVVLALYPANDLNTDCSLLEKSYWKIYSKENKLKLPECESNAKSWRSEPSIARALRDTATIQALIHTLPGGFLREIISGISVSESTHFVLADQQVVEKARVKFHSQLTSLNNVNVRTNFNNSKLFLLDAKNTLSEKSIGFTVLIIPSKEYVLYNWATENGQEISKEFEILIRNQIRLVREYKNFLSASQIDFLDATPYVTEGLSKAVENGDVFYMLHDGHPLEPGYAAYANAALVALNFKWARELVNRQRAE